jgi:aminomethyltransferase
MTDARYTPLRARHEALGASFTDFGGWQMPVRYTSDLAEHHAVREAAGIFDISHMAEFTIRAAGAGDYLDYALAGRLSALAVGKAKYSLLLAEDGGIIDDVIVYRLADDDYLIISNAGNRDAAREALQSRSEGRDVDVVDVSDDYALIAVQGPHAEAILAATEGIADVSIPWAEQKYYAWATASFAGKPLLLARTGYTGEDGFELLVAAADAAALWDAVIAAGSSHGLVPACRCTATS